MIKPDQIPDEVFEAFQKAWTDASTLSTKECLAAAINAWPGAVWRESGVGREIVSRRIVLPLPPEKETSE